MIKVRNILKNIPKVNIRSQIFRFSTIFPKETEREMLPKGQKQMYPNLPNKVAYDLFGQPKKQACSQYVAIQHGSDVKLNFIYDIQTLLILDLSCF